MDERCENCAYCYTLEHIYQKVGLETSQCCLYFVLAEKEKLVVETFANDRCECFKRRADDG